MRKILIIIFATLSLGLALVSNQVSAISDPDDMEIISLRVYQDFIVSGDWVVLCYYNVEYTSTPTEPAYDTFLFNMYDESGTILYASRAINYYDENLISLYFSPSKVASLGLTWGTGYIVKLIGNPAYFASPIPYKQDTLSNKYVPNIDGDYTQAESHNAMAAWIIEKVGYMEDALLVDLITTTVKGVEVINDTGAFFVEKAIPGIGNYVPELYQYTEKIPIPTTTPYGGDYQASIYGDVVISFAESLDVDGDGLNEWSGSVEPRITSNRVQGNYAIDVEIESPVVATEYNVTYTASDTLDIGDRDLIAYIYCSRASTSFTSSRVRITDANGDYRYWDVAFPPYTWYKFNEDLSVGDGESGTPDMSIAKSFSFRVVAADTTGFYCYVDNVYAKGISGIGALTQQAFEGFGDWLGVGGAWAAGFFFFTIYVISASVIFAVSKKSEAALAISLPVILWAGVAGLLSLATISLIAFLLAAGAAYVLLARGIS